MRHPLVKVTWVDSGSHIDHGWATAETYMKGADPAIVETVGILMAENEEVVVVALTRDTAHDAWYGAQLIARSNIKSYTMLSEV